MVEIVDYEHRFAESFRALNEQWIQQFFQLEDTDRKTLENPGEHVLKGGGHILVATEDGQAVGVCALIKLGDDRFELAKMAVAPGMRGRGIGRLLGEAVKKRAAECGARSLYLESNTKLDAAIALYERLGFRRIEGGSSPYQRCNIQMECRLTG